MPTRPAKTAEDVAETIADTVKSIIDRVVDAEVTKEFARRGGDVAGIIAERGADVGERATEAWKDTRPLRREAAKRVSEATGDAAKWSDGLWRGAVAPALSDLWKRRTVAAGAAGAAVPASRELLESAAVRLGLKERQRDEERRRWGAFFLGLALGAIAGTIAALLTTPKRGSEVRRELGVRADEVRRELGVKADEIAAKAREADWMPVFQREGESGNGHTTAPSTTAAGGVDSPAATVPKPSAAKPPPAKPPTASRELGQPAIGTAQTVKPATTPRKKRADPGSPTQ